MEMLMKSLTLSLMAGISCNIFFGTLLPLKPPRKASSVSLAVTQAWPSLVFTVGFLVIAFSEAPGYLLQPIRVMVVLCAIIQIFYQAGIGKTIFLTAVWCAIYWGLNLLALSIAYALPWQYGGGQGVSEWFCNIFLLCFSLFFRRQYKGWDKGWEGTGWRRFAWLPALSLVVTTLSSITVWYTDSLDKTGVLVFAAGYSVINLLIFYFIGNILKKDEKLRNMELTQLRLQNQMELIENIQENDMRYRQFLHDYKNQLGCIQGMLKAGQTEEAFFYIEELNGSIRKGEDHVDTNHPVVNTVLNQKYLRAQEKGIALVMEVNDLSKLLMSREDIVTLLVNLLDNAIEACEKLKESKVIQFKMILEEGELTISVRNPVKTPVKVKGKRIPTTKKEKNGHGLGILNINKVIEKNQGTSILKCQDGWFYFSAVISGM